MEVDEGGAVLRFGDGEHGAIPAKGARVQASYRYSVDQGANVRA